MARCGNHCAKRRASNLACVLPEDGGFKGLHRHVRRFARFGAISRHRLAAFDGRRLWIRGRRRLENLRVGARHESYGGRTQRRHVVHGGLHVSPEPERPVVLGAHMLEICPAWRRASRPSKCIRLASAARRIRCGSCLTRRPVPAINAVHGSHGESLPLARE